MIHYSYLNKYKTHLHFHDIAKYTNLHNQQIYLRLEYAKNVNVRNRYSCHPINKYAQHYELYIKQIFNLTWNQIHSNYLLHCNPVACKHRKNK